MAPVDPSELLTHATWLRRLARSLVDEAADDVVQDTWVAALRRPPERAPNMRPWLRTVLTNAARLRWRGDTNRNAREHAVADMADGEVPSTEQLLERHELQQVLARLVRELDEPFRSTILLRFGEGLTPTQIARRLGIPAGTVRWRLKEALDRLRTELDALHRGDRRAWMLALAPLAAPRPAAAAPIVPIGIAAGAACAVVVFVLVSARASTPAPTAPPPRELAAVVRSATPSSTSAVAWLAQEGAPARSLTGRVRLVGGAPAAGALVRLIADPLPAREIRTDENGRFDLGEQLPREYSLGASMPGTLAAIQHVDLRGPGAPHEIELVLGDCVASLFGTVVDAAGTPIQGAQVLREGIVGAETDAAGHYELCVLPTAALVAELRIVVRADGFGTLAMAIAPPGRMRRDFVLAPDASISGRVVAADGSPMAHARVSLSLTGPEASVPPERGITLSALTTSDGAFRLAGLAAGTYAIRASSASAVAAPIEVELEAAENRTIELRAASTGVLRGRVVSRGRPIAGVNVAAGDEVAVSQTDGSFVLARVPVGDVELATAPYRRTSGAIHIVEGDRNSVEVNVEPLGVIRGTVRRHGAPVPFARVDINGPSPAGVTADAAGRYEARGLEVGTYAFYCDDRRRTAMFTEDRVFELGAGETRDHDIELAWGGTITGHVVDGRGTPVEDAMVWFRAGMASYCLTDASGAFACSGLSGDTYTATVFPSDGGANAFRFVETPAAVELRDGDARVDNVRLVIEPMLLAIEGTVVDGVGAPVADVAVHAFGVDRKPRFNFQIPAGTVTDDEGRFRLRDLSPGNYFVEVERRGLATRQILAAGARDATLVLDRSPCAGAHGHEVPSTYVKPPASVVWDQSIELVGWSIPATASVDATVELTLIYRALKPVDRKWTIFAHFDSSSLRVNGDHEPAIGWCPTKQWQAGDMIVDRATVRFDRAGHYALTIGFFTGKAPVWENLAVSTAPAAMHDAKRQGVHIADVIVRD